MLDRPGQAEVRMGAAYLPFVRRSVQPTKRCRCLRFNLHTGKRVCSLGAGERIRTQPHHHCRCLAVLLQLACCCGNAGQLLRSCWSAAPVLHYCPACFTPALAQCIASRGIHLPNLCGYTLPLRTLHSRSAPPGGAHWRPGGAQQPAAGPGIPVQHGGRPHKGAPECVVRWIQQQCVWQTRCGCCCLHMA